MYCILSGDAHENQRSWELHFNNEVVIIAMLFFTVSDILLSLEPNADSLRLHLLCAMSESPVHYVADANYQRHWPLNA